MRYIYVFIHINLNFAWAKNYPFNLQTITEFIWFLELQIVRGCGGFPLVIKVIGGSLCGQHAVVWHSRLMKWSDGQFYFSSDTELLAHLQKSLEFSDDKVIIKECFMDLGSFPEDQRIPAAALIDMWAELYELDEDGIQTIANLQELTIRNLASLVMARYAGFYLCTTVFLLCDFFM